MITFKCRHFTVPRPIACFFVFRFNSKPFGAFVRLFLFRLLVLTLVVVIIVQCRRIDYPVSKCCSYEYK